MIGEDMHYSTLVEWEEEIVNEIDIEGSSTYVL